MILAVTGHRPPKLHQGDAWSDKNHASLVSFAAKALNWLHKKDTIEAILTGMALGWDQAIACAAKELELPFRAYIPCAGHESKWPASAQARYAELLSSASEIIQVSALPYKAELMQDRNVRMVDECDQVLALFNGTTGGTANCVLYAQEEEKVIWNVWDQWIRWRDR